MTGPAIIAIPEPDDPTIDDAEIHARAWAMAEKVLDSVPDRLVLLHAAALIHAAIAVDASDPTGALAEILAEHNHVVADLTRIAMSLNPAPTEH